MRRTRLSRCPYKDSLQSLLHEPSFRFAVDRDVWSDAASIVRRAIWRYIQGIACRRRMQCSACGDCSVSSGGGLLLQHGLCGALALMKQPSPAKGSAGRKEDPGQGKSADPGDAELEALRKQVETFRRRTRPNSRTSRLRSLPYTPLPT